MKPTKHQVGQAGEHFVAAEIHRRGASAVTFSGNMPMIDVIASNNDRSRMVSIQVKTKTAGTWQTTIRRGRPGEETDEVTEFWAFVDIGKDPEKRPDFYIAPAWWVENSIHERHEAYLARHGGTSPRDSLHHAIPKSVIKQWQERWDILDIFDSN